MRLPWIQVDADGQTRARLMARLLGIPETQGIGIAISLWTWALEMSPEGDFTGNVPGEPELLSAAVSWPEEDTQRLLKQMQRVGLIQALPTLRVRGLERYRPTWEKNRRKGHGKDNIPEIGGTRAGSERAPGVSRRNPERKTETETENEKPSPPPTQIWPQQPRPKPKRDRKLSAAEEFFAWLSARRAAKTPRSDQAHTVAALNAVFGRALVDVGRPQLEAKYLAYLDDPDGASKEPPWPWRGFAARYQTLRAPASQQTTKVLSATERRDLYGAQQ